MPETLSRHFGHLFIRDPLVIIEEYLHPMDVKRFRPIKFRFK